MQVRYPWHPLHGQVVDVLAEHGAAGERSYVIVLADGSKAMLPIWMTEAAAAHEVALTTTPRVSIAALETVRSLLDAIRDRPEADGRR